MNISEAKCQSPQQRNTISKASPQEGEEFQFEMSAFYKAVLMSTLKGLIISGRAPNGADGGITDKR